MNNPSEAVRALRLFIEGEALPNKQGALRALEALAAEVEGLRADARRYRAIRGGCGLNAVGESEGLQVTQWYGDGMGQAVTGDFLDAAIDATEKCDG